MAPPARWGSKPPRLFRPELSEEEKRRLYDQVFLYLDYLPDEEYYSLADITGEPKKRE